MKTWPGPKNAHNFLGMLADHFLSVVLHLSFYSTNQIFHFPFLPTLDSFFLQASSWQLSKPEVLSRKLGWAEVGIGGSKYGKRKDERWINEVE